MKMKILIIIICLVLMRSVTYADKFKVALFSPKASSPFWTLAVDLAQEAADDLGMELRVYNAGLSQYKMQQQLKEAVSGPDKADAVLFQNFKQFAPRFMEIAEKEKVYSFLFNSGLTPEQSKKYGKPREKYKYWIGQILPDDEGAAAKAADLLFDEAKAHKRTSSQGKVHMAGISGIASDAGSITRINGLKGAVAERNDVVLHQVVPTDYGMKMGKEKFLWLIQRYPQITAVWSASYRITDGILNGMHEQSLVPGKDIFTNSVVLNENALQKVKAEELVVTVGGHYIEGAWVIVMLYDYLSGIDFSSESLELKTPMGIVTKDNVDLYLEKITDKKLSRENLKKIDFAKYSKQKNPGLKKYYFDLDSVLAQL